MVKILWKFGINAAALWLIGLVVAPALPLDYLTIAKIAAILAIVNFLL